MTDHVRNLIHAVDPYEGFDETQYPDDLQGWGGHQEFWTEMVKKVQAARVLEIGSWKGRSAAAIAGALAIGPHSNPELVCVDTWLGATEFYGNFEDETRYRGLGMLHGYPTVYYQFLSNMKRRGLDRVVTPFAQTSTNALRFLRRNHVRFDLIYIDASHEYTDVKDDIENAWPLLREGGRMVGDDYCAHWHGVVKAVDEFVEAHNLGDPNDKYFEHRQYPGEKYPSDYWIVRRPYE